MSLYEKLSEERKRLQEKGQIPNWFTTGGWQLFKEKYLYDTDEAFYGQVRRIAKTAAKHLSGSEVWEDRFFTLLWNGWLSASTPVLANMGTKRGLPISCSGQVIDDSIYGFYASRLETAVLTKQGFGTSAYFGNVRPRGSTISGGGKASGSVPVLKGFVQDMRDVSQAGVRRGSMAGYLPIDHGDFWEWSDLLKNEPDDLNVGWTIRDDFIARLDAGDADALARLRRALKVKAQTGKGYFHFPDKVNRLRPDAYINHGLEVLASNLCIEIDLFSDINHTFTCVLSSMNLAKYDEWKDTDAIQWATIFLDCVVAEFLEKARHIPGMENAIRFTEKGRALGLGVCGLHTLMMKRGLAFGGFEAHTLNNRIFKELHDESLKASEWLAETFGEPEWCKGTGRRNTHRTAIAPTMSTASIMGGVSQGIEPIIGNVWTQSGAAGEMKRVNPVFLDLMKERGKYSKKLLDDVAENMGSVQHLDWLTDQEKEIFKTSFEIDQTAILRLASTRQRHICQGQSLNLFFDANESEAYISKIHEMAFRDPYILGLYYLRTQAGVLASKDSCEACQ